VWLWIRIILIVAGVPFFHHFSEYVRSERFADPRVQEQLQLLRDHRQLLGDDGSSILQFVFACATMAALPIIFLLSGRFRSVPPKKFHIPSWYDSPNQPTGEIIMLDFLGWFALFGFGYAVVLERVKYGRFVEFEPTQLTSWAVPISALLMLVSIRIGVKLLAYFDGRNETRLLSK